MQNVDVNKWNPRNNNLSNDLSDVQFYFENKKSKLKFISPFVLFFNKLKLKTV